MTEAVGTKPSTGWIFWVVVALGLLWNSYGAYDYFMSKTQGETYYRQMGMTDAQIAFFNSYPLWMTAVWAIGVWGGLLGAVLLLARRRLAVPVFVASLAAFVVSLIYGYVLSPNTAVNDQQTLIMQGVVLAGCVFFVWYSQRMAKAGVLR
jgi:hypothetical protein